MYHTAGMVFAGRWLTSALLACPAAVEVVEARVGVSLAHGLMGDSCALAVSDARLRFVLRRVARCAWWLRLTSGELKLRQLVALLLLVLSEALGGGSGNSSGGLGGGGGGLGGLGGPNGALLLSVEEAEVEALLSIVISLYIYIYLNGGEEANVGNLLSIIT
ncbi:hypothetical protein T492DRAFT_835365 [Pavlovales sp. CCMP2436]|nr:hypothetical protein T492DRAFT_835365 [Pavlovales sp. CCMP2436]